MEVYCLIGASGTGKSHRASLISHKYDIPLILDDGLLIQGTRVLAGKSAKRELTRIGAVKRAIFYDNQHAQEVKEKISSSNHKKILILGTSLRMTERIARRLDLPSPTNIINIEEISSPKSIAKALRLRKDQNQHVIPIPTFEVKKNFPGYIIDPLKFLIRKPSTPHVWVERSIVRPVFSSLGSFYIATQALNQLVENRGKNVSGIHRILKVNFNPNPEGVLINIDVSLELQGPLLPILQELQKVIKEELEFVTGFNVLAVNINAKKIHIPHDILR